MIDINEIQGLLPHRYPFLMVDRVVDFESGVKAVGIKNVTINEPSSSATFPETP